MAHELVHKADAESSVRSNDESADEGGKDGINRRGYLKAGGAAVATLLIGGGATGSSSEGVSDGEVYWTNFSDGAL